MISITQLIFLIIIIILLFGDIKNITNKIKKLFSLNKKGDKK